MNLPEKSGRSSNFYVLVFGGFMLVGLMALAWLGTPPVASAVGEPMPQLDLSPLVHVEQPLQLQDLVGKLTVFHFWGTWCPPCQREFPDFAHLAAEFADNPQVVIVSVSSSPGPEYDVDSLRQQTLEFMSPYQVQIPTYVDAAAMTRSKVGLLLPGGTFSYPTTLLVDRQGIIVEAVVGYMPGDMEKLATKIRSRLGVTGVTVQQAPQFAGGG